MITPEQQAYIEARAYVPDHLPAYVTAISSVEPFLVDDFVVYVGQDHLIFVGYPLSEKPDETQMAKALDEATTRFDPRLISITAPHLPPSLAGCEPAPADSYYRLELSSLSVPQKVRNMVNRADREVTVQKTKGFGQEHQKLIDQFLQAHQLDPATQFIFKRIPEYVKIGTARLLEARNNSQELVAFDVAEFGAQDYAFYMFNFCSRRRYVPGVSDLLLSKIIEEADAAAKRYINLGLGINEGVTFFKTKWGGRPFLAHLACNQERTRASMWQTLFDSLLS